MRLSAATVLRRTSCWNSKVRDESTIWTLPPAKLADEVEQYVQPPGPHIEVLRQCVELIDEDEHRPIGRERGDELARRSVEAETCL